MRLRGGGRGERLPGLVERTHWIESWDGAILWKMSHNMEVDLRLQDLIPKASWSIKAMRTRSQVLTSRKCLFIDEDGFKFLAAKSK